MCLPDIGGASSSSFQLVVDQPRQSPASALPPVAEAERPTHLGEYVPMNPDIDRPSPPSNGGTAKRFPLGSPEDPLSPSHVFESTSLEQSLLAKEFDSSTFVVKRSASGSSHLGSPLSQGPQMEPLVISPGNAFCTEEEEEDEEDAVDYDNLMAYFDNLRESVA